MKYLAVLVLIVCAACGVGGLPSGPAGYEAAAAGMRQATAEAWQIQARQMTIEAGRTVDAASYQQTEQAAQATATAGNYTATALQWEAQGTQIAGQMTQTAQAYQVTRDWYAENVRRDQERRMANLQETSMVAAAQATQTAMSWAVTKTEYAAQLQIGGGVVLVCGAFLLILAVLVPYGLRRWKRALVVEMSFGALLPDGYGGYRFQPFAPLPPAVQTVDPQGGPTPPARPPINDWQAQRRLGTPSVRTVNGRAAQLVADSATILNSGWQGDQIAGVRDLPQWNSDAWTATVESLKRAGIVETSTGPGGGVFLVQDGPYETLSQLYIAITRGRLDLSPTGMMDGG